MPKVHVCAGGGGVGKTTTAAALALALARHGQRTLVVTVDPARRLAQAMGVEVDSTVHPAHVERAVEGKLFALMPEPRRSTRTFIEYLYRHQPDALERVLDNRIYRTLGDALAGMHELVSLMLVARAVEESTFDHVVIDTAPSRYALDFVTYPGKLATLLEGKAVGWFGSLAQRASPTDDPAPRDEKGLLAWGRKRVESLVGRLLDPESLRDFAALFGDLALVREPFAELARFAEGLLLGPKAAYLLVAAPTGAAKADLLFLAKRLRALQHRPSLLILNRSEGAPPPWLERLSGAGDEGSPLREALEQVRQETSRRKDAGDAMARELSKKLSGVPTLRLPTVEKRDPVVVVRTLADRLGEDPRLVG